MHIKIYRKKKKMEVFIMTSVHYYHYLARLKFRFSQKNYLNQSFIFFNLAYAPSMSIIWDEYGKETKKTPSFVFRQVQFTGNILLFVCHFLAVSFCFGHNKDYTSHKIREK